MCPVGYVLSLSCSTLAIDLKNMWFPLFTRFIHANGSSRWRCASRERCHRGCGGRGTLNGHCALRRGGAAQRCIYKRKKEFVPCQILHLENDRSPPPAPWRGWASDAASSPPWAHLPTSGSHKRQERRRGRERPAAVLRMALEAEVEGVVEALWVELDDLVRVRGSGSGLGSGLGSGSGLGLGSSSMTSARRPLSSLPEKVRPASSRRGTRPGLTWLGG